MKLSQAQSLLLQGILPLLGGALTSAVVAGFQLAFQGHLDATTFYVFILSSFWNGVIKAFAAYIPAHIPVELQAVQDTQAQLLQGHTQILSELGNLTTVRPALRPVQLQAIAAQPTVPTAALPAFLPPTRPPAPVPQQDFPVQPSSDQGG